MLYIFAGIGFFRLLVLLVFAVMGLLFYTGSVPGVYSPADSSQKAE